VALISGSYRCGRVTPERRLSHTTIAGQPAIASKQCTCAVTQYSSSWDGNASAYSQLDAPRTATNSSARITISPVRRSQTGTVSPGKSTNSFSPATCDWRIVTSTWPRHCRYKFANWEYPYPSGCASRYSTHSSCSVTPLRRSSLCTRCQSGTGRVTTDGAAGGYSRASSPASSSSPGNGHFRPADAARRR
jgi:hypothetical protein